MSSVSKSIFKSIFTGPFRNAFGSEGTSYPYANLLAFYNGVIDDGKLIAYRPVASHTTQQVKGSAFTGAGTGACAGLLTTDTITAGGGTAPTCSVNGTLIISADCWDIEVHRAGVLWASWKGINVGQATELDASGNGHHLVLTTTTIIERLDGTGTNYFNTVGGSIVATLSGTV